jgi:hypothetical protein
VTTVTKSVNVDNAPVTLTLSGPGDVPASSPAQTAAVTATVDSGPSGAEIFCSVDGAAAVERAGARADVSVAGLGQHHYACYAQNHATDASGTPARSATQTFDLSIRQPTAEAVSFARIADALRCRTVTVRIRVPGRVRTVRRHGRTIERRGRSHFVRRRVRRCLARTVRKRVTIVVRQHGRLVKHSRIVRVVLAPHAVSKPTRTVAHGRATTVSGYLGLLNGTPLAGRTVRVLAAADDGRQQFTPFATVTTGANGAWTTSVPAGPSRLIEAVYGGDGTEEPTVSAPVKLTVPAKIRLLRVTRRVPWGGTVRIVGQLYGGYLPPGGALVRLRYGFGRRARATFGVVQHVTGDGRFATSFTFGPGAPGIKEKFWFSASLLGHPDYPFAPASSPRRYVVVGGRSYKS